MPTSLNDIVSEEAFAVRWLVEGHASVDWVHSSDLDDPTPFLSSGQLLLTTGRQFVRASAATYRSYVERLQAVGVVAVGFGTEVVRAGTPAELVEACFLAKMPLVEVPYDTPFIAVARFVADREAAHVRERVQWALDTQSVIARVASSGDDHVGPGLAAAVGEAARHLGAEVWIFDADAVVLEQAAGSITEQGRTSASSMRELRHAVGESLRSHRRTESVIDSVLLYTLGTPGRLNGAIAWRRDEPFTAMDESVITMVNALAEISLEHAEDLRRGRRAMTGQLLQLLRDGRVDTVRSAAEVLHISLPTDRFVVMSIDGAAVTPAQRDSIERRAGRPRKGFFAAPWEEHLLLLIDEGTAPGEQEHLALLGATAGLSDPIRWPELASGIAQATQARQNARPGEIVDFATLIGRSFFGLLATSSVAEIAKARLAAVSQSAYGRESLRMAEVWLGHNGRWEPAARELDLHRHSLRLRVEKLAATVGVSLDTFSGRAELWTLLAAAKVQ